MGSPTTAASVLIPSEHSLDLSHRYYAPTMLFFGSASLVVAFIPLLFVGYSDYVHKTGNPMLKHDYESGHGYWTATVSEMVHDHDSVGGKLFYTFGMISGACIFVSMYPYNLRNVNTGNDKVPGTPIYWTTFRQLIIPMGVWLLIGVNTYPAPLAMASPGKTKVWCIALHQAGAGAVFIGYTICEMKCLGMYPFTRRDEFLAIEGAERTVRKLFAWIIILFFFLFIVSQALIIMGPSKLGLCCTDKWAARGEEIQHKTHDGRITITLEEPELLDTATGTIFLLKLSSFICEDIFVLAMVFSHIAIWYFCEERHVEYGEMKLKEVYKQHGP